MNPPHDFLPLTNTVAPPNQDAAAEAVRQACQAGTPVYPIGGSTHMAYGVRPKEPGLGLSLAGVGRVVDYPARDLTITVEAGMRMAALAKRLAAEGQRLPVDVPLPAHATVGGAIAVNAAGPRQLRWGSMRDYVIGVRAIDGSGQAFAAGGRVVKNAAGYDLCRLLTGSFGTLGVIVQASLMVKPMPEMSAFLACEVSDGDAAEDLLNRLVHTRTLPSAVELLAGPAWQQVPALGALSQPHALRLVVGLEGSLAEVEWMIGQLQEEWRQAGVASPRSVVGRRADPLWERLSEFAATAAADHADRAIVVQVNVLSSAVVGVVRRVCELDPRASIEAHAANGVILARLPLPAPEAAELLDRQLRPAVTALGGYLAVLAQPPEIAFGRETIFGPAPNAWSVMQAIKDRFDPKGILNRGRFLFPSAAS